MIDQRSILLTELENLQKSRRDAVAGYERTGDRNYWREACQVSRSITAKLHELEQTGLDSLDNALDGLMATKQRWRGALGDYGRGGEAATTNHTIDGRRMQFVTCSIHESLHNLGDFAHGQNTEFDPSDDNAPGRYSWAIHPDDSSALICRDNVTEEYKAGQIDKYTQWVAEFIREALKAVRGRTS